MVLEFSDFASGSLKRYANSVVIPRTIITIDGNSLGPLHLRSRRIDCMSVLTPALFKCATRSDFMVNNDLMKETHTCEDARAHLSRLELVSAH